MNDAHKKNNTFEIKDDYCEVYDCSGNYFIIDTDDIDIVKEHYWYVDKKTQYVHTHIWDSEKQKDLKLSINRYLTGEKYADHINHNPIDNRRSNLRIGNDYSISNQSYNNMNHIEDRKNNTSSKVGVSFDNTHKKWKAYIGLNNKTINLGTFSNFDDAVAARKVAEEKYFGEFSYDNSQKLAINNKLK